MFKNNSAFNVLYTADIGATHDFYNKLGLEIKELAEGKVVVSFGGFELHFILSTKEPFEEYRYIAEPGNFGQGIIFYVETEDINKAEIAIQEAGGVVKKTTFDNLWGCKELLFEDPNGYKFALYQ